MRYIASLMPSDAVVADIGAGTGKFTVPLAQAGFEVLAVEPDADMRGELAVQTAARVLPASADPRIPQPDPLHPRQLARVHGLAFPQPAAHRAWVDAIFDRHGVDGIMTDDNVCMVASEIL